MSKNLIHIKENGEFEVELELLLMQEDELIAAYSPALELCAYGSNEEEAKSKFLIELKIFMEETTEKGTLLQYLKKHKWFQEQPSRYMPAYPSLKNMQDIFQNNNVIGTERIAGILA